MAHRKNLSNSGSTLIIIGALDVSTGANAARRVLLDVYSNTTNQLNQLMEQGNYSEYPAAILQEIQQLANDLAVMTAILHRYYPDINNKSVVSDSLKASMKLNHNHKMTADVVVSMRDKMNSLTQGELPDTKRLPSSVSNANSGAATDSKTSKRKSPKKQSQQQRDQHHAQVFDKPKTLTDNKITDTPSIDGDANKRRQFEPLKH